jgi:hypothetical protein
VVVDFNMGHSLIFELFEVIEEVCGGHGSRKSQLKGDFQFIRSNNESEKPRGIFGNGLTHPEIPLSHSSTSF